MTSGAHPPESSETKRCRSRRSSVLPPSPSTKVRAPREPKPWGRISSLHLHQKTTAALHGSAAVGHAHQVECGRHAAAGIVVEVPRPRGPGVLVHMMTHTGAGGVEDVHGPLGGQVAHLE